MHWPVFHQGCRSYIRICLLIQFEVAPGRTYIKEKKTQPSQAPSGPPARRKEAPHTYIVPLQEVVECEPRVRADDRVASENQHLLRKHAVFFPVSKSMLLKQPRYERDGSNDKEITSKYLLQIHRSVISWYCFFLRCRSSSGITVKKTFFATINRCSPGLISSPA